MTPDEEELTAATPQSTPARPLFQLSHVIKWRDGARGPEAYVAWRDSWIPVDQLHLYAYKRIFDRRMNAGVEEVFVSWFNEWVPYDDLEWA
jgi:hypothetical protein